MKQIRLSGSGGQGVITAAIILAETAIAENKEAVQSQSYGPEARGGASKAEVIISDSFIYHPKVNAPDIVLALTQEAADKYYADLKADGVLIVDEDLVPEIPAFKNVVKVPITRLAVDQLGNSIFANIVSLGVIVKKSKIVDLETLKKVVAKRVPPATIEKNMEAVMVGYNSID